MANILDAIIIGQGLAGTALSHLFISQNISFKIISADEISSSSKIAAGIINPIVTKRYVPVWRATEFMDFCHQFYTKIEENLEEEFYHQKNIYKIIGSAEEQAFYQLRFQKEILLKEYANEEIIKLDTDKINAPFGAIELKNTSKLTVEKYLEISKNYFQKMELIFNENFNKDVLRIENNLVYYKGLIAKKIIFCEGYLAIKNDLFPKLKFNLVKGELIQFRSKELQLDKILNKQLYIVPNGDDMYTAGATYEWKELNEHVTKKGIEILQNDLSKIIKTPFEIIQSKAGIRPATIDRRPILGFLANNSCIGILNGLGTRGAMLAPLLANELLQNMVNATPIHIDCDVNRFG